MVAGEKQRSTPDPGMSARRKRKEFVLGAILQQGRCELTLLLGNGPRVSMTQPQVWECPNCRARSLLDPPGHENNLGFERQVPAEDVLSARTEQHLLLPMAQEQPEELLICTVPISGAGEEGRGPWG